MTGLRRRGKPGRYPPPGAHEDWPRRPFPTAAQMHRAWAHAALMDPLAVLPLLHVHESRPQYARPACLELRSVCVAALPESTREVLADCEYTGDATRLSEVWPMVEDHFRE